MKKNKPKKALILCICAAMLLCVVALVCLGAFMGYGPLHKVRNLITASYEGNGMEYGFDAIEQIENPLKGKNICVLGSSVVYGYEWIDGFNTVITLEVMLNESILFMGMDGCIRDLASLRGTYRTIPETAQAVRLLIEQLMENNVGRSHILLDRPVSNSGRLKTLIAEIAEEESCDIDIQIIDDVDRILWEKTNVITSDAIILDHCSSWGNLLAGCAKNHEAKVLQVW